MKRTLALFGGMALCVTMVGCATDPREGLVAAAVEDLNTAASKVTTIKTRLEDAFKKAKETGKDPDFKDVLLDVDGLKKIATEMKIKRNQALALKTSTTTEEQKVLANSIKSKLNDVIGRLSK